MLQLDTSTPCPECGRYANRAITVDAVMVKDNKILLIKCGAEPFKNYWALCGGHIDWDETAEQAAIREVKEELGLTVTSIKFINYYTDPNRHPKQAVNFAFAVEVEGEPVAGDDAEEFRFFARDELPKELAFDHATILSDFLKMQEGK